MGAFVRRGRRIPTCCKFVDGTVFKSHRATKGSYSAYNGPKEMHAMRYVMLKLSNLMVGNFDGPCTLPLCDTNDLEMIKCEDCFGGVAFDLHEEVTL